jgi:sodium-dependent dicarboxylate transporter 2/3/5
MIETDKTQNQEHIPLSNIEPSEISNWTPTPIPKRLNEFLYHKGNFLVCLIISIGVYYLLTSQPYSIRITLAIFTFSALCWVLEVFPLPITGLMIPVLFVFSGLYNTKTAFEHFSHPVIFLLIGGLVLGQAIHCHELDKWLSYKVIIFSKGSSNRLFLIIVMITAFLSMWLSNTVAIAIFLPVILSIFSTIPEDQIKIKKKTLIGMLLSATVGGMAMLTGSTPALIAAAALESERPFGFIQWAYYGIPISIICIIIVIIILNSLYRIQDVKFDITSINRKKDEIEPLTMSQKAVLVIFGLTIFFWFLGSEIEILLGLPPSLSSVALVSIISVLLLFGLDLMNMKDMSKINWEIAFLVGGGLLLGDSMIKSGTASSIGSMVSHSTNIIPTIFIFLFFLVIAVFLTNFISNPAAAAIMVPISIETAKYTGSNPTLFVMGVALAAIISFITPVGAPSTAMIYGTGELSKKEIVKTGLIVASLMIFIIYMYLLLFPIP